MNTHEAATFLEKHGEQVARKFLRSTREHARLNQLELSKLSGVPQSNIHRIEHGKQGISPHVLSRLLRVIEKRIEKNHRDARRDQKVLELSQKYGVLPEADLLALWRKEEKAERDRIYKEAFDKYTKEFAALGNLTAYATLRQLVEGTGTTSVVPLPELLATSRTQEAERKRQLAALENAQSLDDPIVKEVIQLFREEIDRLEKTNEFLSHELEKTKADADD